MWAEEVASFAEGGARLWGEGGEVEEEERRRWKRRRRRWRSGRGGEEKVKKWKVGGDKVEKR
jgi:hypothetical protein